VLLLIPTISTTNVYVITALFALATFSYAAFSTIANVLPSDLFESDSVASVSGVSGIAAGIGTIIAFKLIGHYLDLRLATATQVFDPIMVVAGLIPFFGMILVLLLVRNTGATRRRMVREI
jgi:ACS family hexuronate transporter-like MFS transporter